MLLTMTEAQCYYEILNISEAATTEEVKQAYKKLALIWHPDKNQTNPEEAHAKFQTILKAYETLSDNREREWYDRHKDQILSDGKQDEANQCLNLFQYFSSSCYANFDDSDDGFYTVYRNVFDQVRQEEERAIQLTSKYAKNKSKTSRGDRDSNIGTFPTFGNSQSPYEEIVRPFYAFWSGFCTSLTFDHLDKWNTTEAENRKILRAMEKENKKVKDAARKERNTNVRNLVEFIKKRDRRLKAHKLLVEQQNEINRQKTAEKQRQQREKLSKNSVTSKQTSYLEMYDMEAQLQQLESEYDDVPVADNSDNADDDDDDDQAKCFFCPACNKEFRTLNAFENHEASKKHKREVQKLTSLLKAEENKLNK